MYDVHTRSSALEFLREKGTKVALQVGHEGDYVYAEKTDFINIILRGPMGRVHDEFVNYDGRPVPAFVEGNVLHLPCGVF